MPSTSGSPTPKMRMSADSFQPQGASLESCCSASSAHGTARIEAQRLGLLDSLATSNFQRSLSIGGGPCHAPINPAPKMRTSADSTQPQRTTLESCCSASSAHGTAHTEAQRLEPLACLVTSNLKRSLGGPCRAPPAALLPKGERLQIARSQKGLAWKDVAQPHLPMVLLAQWHRDWGCLVVLPPQTSNIALGGPCRAPPAALLRKCKCVQKNHSKKELSWKAVAQPHLPMALLAQWHRDWGCLLVLPPQTSYIS